MAETDEAADIAAEEDPRWTARKLLRAARAGTLATQNQGMPFAGLVTPATAADLSPLLLLSDLSEHTKQLRRDPRCAVMVTGESPEANPQTIPRVTFTGRAEIDRSAALRARYLAVHPYAALYVGFGDFNLWRVVPEQGFFVGGFARARTLRWADVVPAAAAVAALEGAAEDILSHCNADHPDALTVIAGGGGDWRMVAVDADGCDLAQAGDPEARVVRVNWPRPASGPDDVRRALILLAARARASSQVSHHAPMDHDRTERGDP